MRRWRFKPNDVAARVARADVFLSLRHPDAAISEYRAALLKEPNNVPALMGVAMADQAAGRRIDAEQGYRAVLTVDPRQALALNNLAWLLSEQKLKLDDALALAKQAVEILPGRPNSTTRLHGCYVN